MSIRPCRVWSEPPAPGAVHVARDRVHLEGSVAGDEARLRFHRYQPTASLGRFEAVCQSVREDYCAETGIPVVRRLTGGGALYLAPEQCCLSLTLPRHWLGDGDTLTALMARLNRALARALQSLGVPARTAFPNDLEVDGRKLGSGFLAMDAESVLYQAVLLEDLDTETLLKVLRAPREKLSSQGILSARQRFITLGELPGEAPDMEAAKAAVTQSLMKELALDAVAAPPERWMALDPGRAPPAVDPALQEDWSDGSKDRWEAFLPTAGGVLHLRLTPDTEGRVVQEAVFAGAVHVSPPDLFRSLADAITGAPVDAAEVRLIRRLRTHAGQTPGFGPDELSLLLRLALGRRSEQALGLSNWQANRLMVHRVTGNETARQILDRATVMLVPYCAKPAWCRWRHEDGCPECGACEVGEAYRLARERGLEVVTITQYEHLCDVLEQMQARGVPAYVGMCCRHFYLKRIHAFRNAGIPAVLMDISGSNCYELGQEDEAYAGRFTAEAQLDGELLEQVMVWVPKMPGQS
ncbi:MAG: DUF116 domain-containing protein [Thioalkalivibrio sp.]